MATLDRQMGQSPICLSKGGVHIIREPKSGVPGPPLPPPSAMVSFWLNPPLPADVICERPLIVTFQDRCLLHHGNQFRLKNYQVVPVLHK